MSEFEEMIDETGGYYYFKNEPQKQAALEHWARGCPAPEFLLTFALGEDETDFSKIKMDDALKLKIQLHLKECRGCDFAVAMIRGMIEM